MDEVIRVTTTTSPPTSEQIVRFLHAEGWTRTDKNVNFARWLAPDEQQTIIAGNRMEQNFIGLLLPKLAKYYGVETLEIVRRIKGEATRLEMVEHMLFELVSLLNYETDESHRKIAVDALRLIGFDDNHIRLFFDGEIVSFGDGQ